MRRAAKVDANQREIVDAFRKLGCSVLSLAALGHGVPDLLVAIHGITWLVEVKMQKGKETSDQIRFANAWKGSRIVVRDLIAVKNAVTEMQLTHTAKRVICENA